MSQKIEVGDFVDIGYRRITLEVIAIEFDESNERILICKKRNGNISICHESSAIKIDIESYPRVNNQEEEIWIDMTEFKGQYQISNFGRIKSIHYGGTLKKQGIMIAASPMKFYFNSVKYYIRRIDLIKKYLHSYDSENEQNDINEEAWEITEFEGRLYNVSSLGCIKTVYDNQKKDYHKYYDEDGIYYQYRNYDFIKPYFFIAPRTVYINRNSRNSGILVHHLVALAHIPNPNQYQFVVHKNQLDFTNNSIANLEWSSCEFDFSSIPTYYNRIFFDTHELLWKVDLPCGSSSFSNREFYCYFISKDDALSAFKKNDNLYKMIKKSIDQSNIQIESTDTKIESVYKRLLRYTIDFNSISEVEKYSKMSIELVKEM